MGRRATAQRDSDDLDAELLKALAGLHRVVPQEGLLDVLHRAPKFSGEGILDGVCGASGNSPGLGISGHSDSEARDAGDALHVAVERGLHRPFFGETLFYARR